MRAQLITAHDELYKSSRDHLSAVVAFYKWRHIKLRSQYRQRVQEVLDEVSEEDAAHGELKRSYEELKEK